ncbi:MAG: carbohydrate ABC transporter permease [Aggregatilineales bacterium]
MQQVALTVAAIFVGVGGMALYFYGSNWLLDRLLADQVTPDGRVIKSRTRARDAIRPWLFVGPALIVLTIYLVYPAIQTFSLSFQDALSRNFVGLDNYIWAVNDPGFQISIRNNILWLIVVPITSTAFGLVVAVLSDRVRWENVAKSLIFMPMAISFVGAAIIWRFVYAYRPPGQEQIGILNAALVALGGQPSTWYTEPPLNNLALMVILIWIQAGFAMVLLSAALKGVPEETLEAARIDGASEIQIFFYIMLPQIVTTITVVMTTIIIVVLKVFDIVFTMTNGQFETEVLANYMYRWMFRNFDNGRGSMIAVTIMAAITPILIWNIIRFHREERSR